MSETFISLENLNKYTLDLLNHLYNVGTNKLNKNAVHDGYINNSGEYTYSSSYKYVYIPVKNGDTVRASFSMRFVNLCDKTKEFVSSLGVNVTSGVTATQDGYVCISIYYTYVDNGMITVNEEIPSSYVAYERTYKSLVLDDNNIKNGSLKPIKVSFLKQTVNIFNKATVTKNKYRSTDGETSSTTYSYTDFIPVEYGKTYSFSSPVRSVVGFYENKTSAINVSTTETSTITISDVSVKYVILNLYNSTYNENAFMVVEGTTFPKYYAQYGYEFTDDIIFEGELNHKMSVSKNDNDLIISSILKDGSTQISTCKISYGGNNLFNFFKETIQKNEIQHTKSADDDITPFRLNTVTLGANHGYPTLFYITNTDKTTDDIGSQWKDSNNRTFTLFSIDSDNGKVGFISDVTQYNGVTVPDTHEPYGTLTHLQDGTHTNNISVANLVTEQIYPSVKNINRKITLDKGDKDLTYFNGNFNANELNVYESYEIVDYEAILDSLHDNIGSDYDINNVSETIAKISVNYKFIGEGKCVVNSSLVALKDLVLSSCGLVQAQRIIPDTNETAYYYVGNVNEKNGINLSTKVNSTSLSSGISLGKTDLSNVSIPANKVVNMLYNSSNERIFGFSLGYIIDKTMSSNENRLNHCETLMEIRSSSLKMYPVAYQLFDNAQTYPKVMPEGKIFNGIAFRVMFGQENPKATSIYDIKVGNDYYVFIDYNETAQLENYPLSDCIGCEIEILQSNSNFELINDTVDNSGINFNINGSYGWAVLKIHK